MSQPLPPPPMHPHPEPRTYPLMLRTWTYAAWQPALGVFLLTIGMIVVAPLVLLPVLALGVALDHRGSFTGAFTDAATLKHVTWPAMLYLNLTLAALIPLTWVLMRWLHRLRPCWLMSVRPGIRWRFFWACLGIAMIAIAAQFVVGAFLPSNPNDIGSHLNRFTPEAIGLALVVVVTTPLQAMGEEYAFRGYAMQAFGSLSKRPWIAIVATAILFALAHGIQNAPLFLDRFAFGLMAGYVVLRTGGLEAGIAMHIWNNLIAFGLALTVGNIDDTLGVQSIPWSNIVLTVTQNGVYLLLVLLLARRMGIRAVTDPPVGAAPGVPVLVPTSPPV